tara:strand:+ start:12322 stop:12495 length:174 start_codon:yes stop_codon:yes gene_type:complete
MNITARTTMADLQREGLRLRYRNVKREIRELYKKRNKSQCDVERLQDLYREWRELSR